MGRRLRIALFGAMGVVTGCATYSDRTQSMRDALDVGDFGGAAKEINREMRAGSSKELPNKWKKNTGLAILERATILQAMGEYELSARDFAEADRELELLDIARDAGGNVAEWVFSGSAKKYKIPPTERLTLNAMNMINFLARGDLDGARIEAKRFTVMRNYLADYDPEHAHGEFGSYLAGFVAEKQGAWDEALRYYDEALQERDFPSLRRAVARAAAKGSFRSPRINLLLEDAAAEGYWKMEPKPAPAKGPAEPATQPAPTVEPSTPSAAPESATPVQRPGGTEPAEPAEPAEPPAGLLASTTAWKGPATHLNRVAPTVKGEGPGEILVLVKVGRVPYKVPERIPIGAAVGIGSAYMTGDPTVLEYGVMKFIVYPQLVAPGNAYDDAAVAIDGKRVSVDVASNLGQQIVREYEEAKPKIIGAALTRMIARAVAAEGARAAGGSADSGGAVIGLLAALAVEGTLVALDKPDTRSWTTMPDLVYVSRITVPPGQHTLQIWARGGKGRTEYREVDVTVPAGGWLVVDATTLR